MRFRPCRSSFFVNEPSPHSTFFWILDLLDILHAELLQDPGRRVPFGKRVRLDEPNVRVGKRMLDHPASGFCGEPSILVTRSDLVTNLDDPVAWFAFVTT
jgi:hypothetical protein